jgi:FMN phosphatase YigB (HAD superfamily)
MKPGFIYFDLGGVVFHFTGGLSKLAEKYGRQYADFEKVFRKYDDQVCRGIISTEELWKHYQSELGFTDPIDFTDYWASNFSPIKEVHTLINELAKENFPIGLLTNVYTGIFDKALVTGAIPNVTYQALIKSCEQKLVKPEIAIYKLAQQSTGQSGHQILFVDDKKDFLKPADELGWQTILFDENNPDQSVNRIRLLLEGN